MRTVRLATTFREHTIEYEDDGCRLTLLFSGFTLMRRSDNVKQLGPEAVPCVGETGLVSLRCYSSH